MPTRNAFEPECRSVRSQAGHRSSVRRASCASRVTTEVYLVEDFPILRDGLRTILEGAGHRVVGEANHPVPAVADLIRLQPLVAVVDLRLDHRSGMEVLEQVNRRHLSSRVIVLSPTEQARDVAEAMRLGASGYLLKDAPAAELLNAVEKVAAGGRYLGPRVQELAVEGLIRQTRHVGIESLSVREKQILMLVLRGATSAAIAHELCLSPKTVESYRSRLMGKLGVDDVPALVRLAIRAGLISLDGD